MSHVLATGGGPSAYWYLTRSTGIVALVLLSAAVTLGVIDVRRLSSPRWPRFVVDGLHGTVSLLAVVFVTLHVLTSVLDGFAPISITAAVIPFIGSYRPFWLGLGAVAFDLLLALVVTSLLRSRLKHSTWRATHWLAYACWPVALLHGFGTGSDARGSWFLLISILCTLAVVGAAAVRLLGGWRANPRTCGTALAGLAAFGLFLIVWLPSGPLEKNWAQRSGTPANLLPHATTKTRGGAVQ
ncbi:MAG: ferric reductase-like transmembrane domain-containing protein [Acidobacteriota bacterium]|nr:ferric reductase-like transmembrane domain-containing protein [Acidobacteriota bacterium]